MRPRTPPRRKGARRHEHRVVFCCARRAHRAVGVLLCVGDVVFVGQPAPARKRRRGRQPPRQDRRRHPRPLRPHPQRHPHRQQPRQHRGVVARLRDRHPARGRAVDVGVHRRADAAGHHLRRDDAEDRRQAERQRHRSAQRVCHPRAVGHSVPRYLARRRARAPHHAPPARRHRRR